ncbi:ATP synthase subunit O mitochondrial [Prunus yedoensis var. nudiflora]|uniref:ATP synthase subunit O mitochondrial n=1 Tax=Prunus yedoensis var. nudiflora TaxID=2094558 RepID=A0A314XYE5_PRUYE|nr:ATP synthase subunit O mitochondrial [Prunus yedoensis var. nudiflora]
MAFAKRIRSSLPLVTKILKSDSLSATHGSSAQRSVLCPTFTNSELSKNFSTAPGKKEVKVKVPLVLFGGSGNYASALYIAAVKANALEKVESEILDIVESTKRSPTFSQFTKDLSVPADTRVKAISDISTQAKFSDVTKNFLVILSQNGRLKNLETIAKRFVELTMAHKGEVKAIVTSVIPLPAVEEKELKETLQELIGQGKKVILEQKIDPSILGGLVVEFDKKVFDMSIKTRARQMERYLREPANLDSL